MTKWRRLKYSNKSFCIGVPDRSILFFVFNFVNAVYVKFSQFFSLWPYTCIYIYMCVCVCLIMRFCVYNNRSTSSQMTSPTSPLCKTSACKRNVSYDIINIGVAVLDPYWVINCSNRFLSFDAIVNIETHWVAYQYHL